MTSGQNSWPLVPDGIEPITAYRAWVYDGGRRSELRSVARGSVWHRDWNVAACTPGGPIRRSSTHLRGHRAPAEECSCGLYALKDPPDVTLLRPHPGAHLIVGKVQLAGKIVEYDAGYRAERARVVELLPFRGQQRDARALAKAYAARISKDLRHVREFPTPVGTRAGIRGRIGWQARAITQGRLPVVYLLLLSQVLGLISKGIRGWGLVAGIGVMTAVGFATTIWTIHVRPRGGRAARPINPSGRLGPIALPFGAWRGRRPYGAFMLPPGA